MRYISLCFLIALCAVPTATTRRAAAQITPPPVFNQIFKQPTGQNGYEELVMAGDLLEHNAVMQALEAPETTLTEKRRALADPDLQKALELVRAGLDKPIVAPHDSADPASPFPMRRFVLNFLAVARLLETEQYVLLADGQTARAVQSLRDGLRFGYAVPNTILRLSRRMGVEIDRTLIEQIVRHLDQLSEHDCDNLLQLVQDWLNADHSPIPELINERKKLLEELAQGRKDPNAVLQEMRDEADFHDDAQGASLLATVGSLDLVQASDAAAALCNEQINAAIANLKLAPWQRQDWKLPPGDTLARRLYRVVAPNLDRSLQRYDEDRARLQLLGVHAAIRRYRWQYDRLPDSLDSLRLENLVIDPFSGKPLSYRRKGDDYELSSVGPNEYDDADARIPGKHTPVTLPR